jgi:hypothetical protein
MIAPFGISGPSVPAEDFAGIAVFDEAASGLGGGAEVVTDLAGGCK